jgi:hypothetical protein
MRRCCVLIIAIVFSLLLTASSSASTVKSCGSLPSEGAYPYKIRALDGTSCRTAKRVANIVSKVTSFGGCTDTTDSPPLQIIIRPCTRLGYRCKTSARFDDTHIRVRCTKRGGGVRFDL